MSTPITIPSVNYHLWKPCNMKCGFCFATFQDIDPHFLPKGHLGREDSLIVVEQLARAGFQKINFAGGEPTLCPWLPDLVTRTKEFGLSTAMVTNGSLLSSAWLGYRRRTPRLGCSEHRLSESGHASADRKDDPVRPIWRY